MRIISDFKDYYDCIQRLGQSDIVYLRKPNTKIIPSNFSSIVGSINNRYKDGIDYIPILIGFCGQYYPLINRVDRINHTSDYYYNKEELLEVTPGRRSYFSIHRFIDKFFDYKWDFPFSYEEPIFVVYGINGLPPSIEIISNCNLGDFHFQRIFDPYSAFQRIHEYLGSQARPEKPIPKLDDITMRDIKGFDKFSFRKDKDEPKRRIKRN